MKESKILLLLLILSLFTFSVSFAQNILDLIAPLTGIILIIVFILILLWLGGVLRFGGGRISFFFIVFILGIILLFVIPQFVPYPTYSQVPENFKIYPLPSYASQFLGMLGLPSEWMYVPAIIYLFILPFAGIYTLVWAFLVSIKIFEGVPSAVNRVLAFIITFLTIPVGWFTKIVWIVFSFLGIWSVVIFGITFIFSIFFRGYGATMEQYYKIGLSKLAGRIKQARSDFNVLKSQAKDLSEGELRAQLKQLREKYSDLSAITEAIPTKESLDGMNKDQLVSTLDNIIKNLK